MSATRQLDGRVAIITGAARGIGRACAERFLEAGADGVVLADIDIAAATVCSHALDPRGDRVLAFEVDVASYAATQDLVERTIERFGHIDIVVNSAGVAGEPGLMENHSESELDRIWAVNVKGTYFTCQAAHPRLVENGWGRVVNLASIAGKEGNPGLVPYSMSKAAVIGFTKAYAKEVARSGILVNCIAPAVIETDILAQISDEVREYMVSKIPMGRVGQPCEVAELALFLASDACSFSTGACFDLSGGRATY